MTGLFNRRLAAAALTVAFLLGTTPDASNVAPAAQAQPRFTKAELFFELNDTDGDLGLHALIDGEPWTQLEIEGPGERQLLRVQPQGTLRRQGLTEIAFESAEPPFDELAPAAFFRRFPEGRYEIEALLLGGGAMETRVSLSHVLAAPPENIRLSGTPAPESCDEALPTVSAPVTIDWDPVTHAHPDVGKRGRVRIVLYQVFVERGDTKIAVDLPPATTEFEVPTAITNGGGEFKFEIIARTSTGNNTAVESCFRVP